MSDIATAYKAIQDLGAAFEEFKKANTAALDEIRKRGDVLGETAQKLERIDTVMEKASQMKEAQERLFAATAAAAGGADPKADPAEVEYAGYLHDYIRRGIENRPDLAGKLYEKRKEVKRLSSLSDPDGGYFLGHDLLTGVVQSVTESSPMRAIANQFTTSQHAVKGRRRTGRATSGGWVGETDARSTTGTPQAGEYDIICREQYAYPEAPQNLLDDAQFAVETWLSEQVAEEFAVTENTAFVNGNGVRRPRGFMTYPAGTDPIAGQIEQVSTATNDVFAAVDLFSLQGALKEPYQRGASWVMNRAVLTAIRKFTESSTSNYLWQPGLLLGIPNTILGQPYQLFQDMPSALTDGLLIAAYGDFKQGYLIVDRAGISVLRDPISNKGFVGFYTTRRVGGDVVNFEAIKILKIQ